MLYSKQFADRYPGLVPAYKPFSCIYDHASFVLDPAKPEVRYVSFRNRQYPAYYYVHEQYEIWGLTGRMLKSFLDLVWQAV